MYCNFVRLFEQSQENGKLGVNILIWMLSGVSTNSKGVYVADFPICKLVKVNQRSFA